MDNKKIKFITSMGDSISVGYSPFIHHFLSTEFHYIPRKGILEAYKDLDKPQGANSGDSGMLYSYLDALHSNKDLKFDVILLNAGLHDIKVDSITKEKLVNIKKYEENLYKIFCILKDNNIETIWILTTDVCDHIHNEKVSEFFRYHNDVIEYNEVAKNVCTKCGVKFIDLYTFTRQFGESAFCDHVHYPKEICEKQAEYIIKEINKKNI